MKKPALISIICLILAGCVSTNEDFQELNESGTESFTFDEQFDFTTSKALSLNISSVSEKSKYRISYTEDGQVHTIGTYGNSGQSIKETFMVPTYLEKLTIEEFSVGGIQLEEVEILNVQEASVSFGAAKGRVEEGCVDRLYAVESSFGGFWSIDVTTSDYTETQLPNLEGGGSIACALDQENAILYYNRGNTLYKYDINTETFDVAHQGNPYGKNYPRLAYDDGYFWMSNGTSMHKVDAITNETIQSYTIQGIENTASGGDVAFTSDGTLYLSCFSGLYKFVSFEGSIATVTRISAENFPYQLTSMAIDRKDRIFVGTNNANSKLLEMNKVDGSYRIVKTYDHKINDLTAWKCAEEELSQRDTDGDGVIDELDDYPEDGEAAYDIFTPSEIGYGTLAFEDQWPLEGDYDFNDMVINYRFTSILNSNNEAVRFKMNFVLTAAGASYRNGFGIELPVDASSIASVSGYSITKNIVTLDGKGLEQGQSNPVIIVFDDALAELGGGSIINTIKNGGYVTPSEFEIVIEFVAPIDGDLVANPPFNPFIFINGDRSRELHLKNQSATDLVNTELFQSGDDRSDVDQQLTYQNEDGVPWGISIIHNFRYPVEKTRINNGYNHFVQWGQSSGNIYSDWYKDNSGYRDDSRLYFAPE